MEHHSNIVPWQILCEQTGARLRIIPITDAGELDLDAYERLLTDRTRIVSVVHVSNVLGTVNPVEEIVRLAHQRGIPVLVDGAQAVAHMPINVQAIGCDFYAFSGHKMCGPTGIGALYGRLELLESMPPYQTGGDMIRSVTLSEPRMPPRRSASKRARRTSPAPSALRPRSTTSRRSVSIASRSTNTRIAELHERRALVDFRPAPVRNGCSQNRCAVVCAEGCASARRWDDSRSRGRGYSGGTSLLSTADGAAWRAGDRADLAGAL